MLTAICATALIGWLALEIKGYYSVAAKGSVPNAEPEAIATIAVVVVAIKVLLVWLLWSQSDFGWRTVVAIALTAADVVYLTHDLISGRKDKLKRTTRGARLWTVNNIVEMALVLLLVFG